MVAWRLDGRPRTACQFTVYKHCPLPMPENRQFFLFTSLKTSALQVVHGRVFGWSKAKPIQWIHVLLPALLAALHTLGAPPCPLPQGPGAAARRLGGQRRHCGCTTGESASTPDRCACCYVGTLLLLMTAPNGASSARKTLLNRLRVIAARKQCQTLPKTASVCGRRASAIW
jgi:hypothetical protein